MATKNTKNHKKEEQNSEVSAGRPPAGFRVLFFVSFCIFCGYFLFFHALVDRDLWSSHEARAGQDAQSILSEGRWGLPHLFDGTPELQKPPLYYWLVAVVGWLRGGRVDAWAVRLPAALAATSLVVGLLLVLWRRGRPAAAVVAAGVLATALHFTDLARTGRIDMPLSLTTAVVVLAFGHARRLSAALPALPSCLVGYFSLAAGVLLKGPIGAVLPLAVVGVHALAEGDWRPRVWPGLLHRLGAWWGVPLVLGLTLPWFLWADAATGGEFGRVFFWHHNVERGLGGSATLKEHAWWLYLPYFAYGFLPWAPLLPVAGWLLVRRGWWREDPAARLGLVWTVVVLLLLSCARFKRADYLLPAFPGAALFLGCVAERWYRSTPRPRLWAAGFGVAVAGCAVGWAVYAGAVQPRSEDLRKGQARFAAEVRRIVPAPAPVLVFWAEPHALVFHLGRPVRTLIEWDRLDAELAAAEQPYVVMPPAQAHESPQHLRLTRLEPVLSNGDLAGVKHDEPLLLLKARRLRHPTDSRHARAAEAASPDRRPDQPRPPGPQ